MANEGYRCNKKDRLIAGHRRIRPVIDEVRRCLPSFSQCYALLVALQQMVIDHTALEDSAFFAAVEERCQGVRESQKLLESLRVDLIDMKVRMVTFFDQCEAWRQGAPAGMFPSVCATFCRDIETRFLMEEEYLLPLLPEDQLPETHQ